MSRNYSILFFDLDGTITDSGPGIMHAFAYSVRKMGGTVSDPEQFRGFVGPPLEDSFGRVLGFSPEDTQRAIAYYREYYFQKGGALENTVYPGMEELLRELQKLGKKLVIATSKGERGTEIVLDHFDLKKYFSFIATSDHGERSTKIDVIRYALRQCGQSDLPGVLMIGDRYHDIEAAKAVGIDSAGVLWGYGSRAELETAGASFVVEKPEEILEIVR